MTTNRDQAEDDPMQPAEDDGPHRRRERRIMALDVGGRRIGVAVSDETRLIATPLRYVLRGHRDRAEIRSLVQTWDVERLVVGMPTGLSGREGPQAADVRAYAEPLSAALSLPLEYWDERLTTTIAEQALISTGTRRAKRREQVDAVAAAVILQSYLDAARHRQRRTAARRPYRPNEDGPQEV
ncbi:MAG: Holliday junction resolvase RuvX [Chloroflexota bacterium]|nr:Holliday junction resolvase RuvX [Chloroflexota bacterium]